MKKVDQETTIGKQEAQSEGKNRASKMPEPLFIVGRKVVSPLPLKASTVDELVRERAEKLASRLRIDPKKVEISGGAAAMRVQTTRGSEA